MLATLPATSNSVAHAALDHFPARTRRRTHAAAARVLRSMLA
jgi:hypothetical protein